MGGVGGRLQGAFERGGRGREGGVGDAEAIRNPHTEAFCGVLGECRCFDLLLLP